MDEKILKREQEIEGEIQKELHHVEKLEEELLHIEEAKCHEVEVTVKSLKTGERAVFRINDDAQLGRVWDEANEKLKERRLPGDTFRCANGIDLTQRLKETLAELHHQGVCSGRHFEIKGPSGGACA